VFFIIKKGLGTKVVFPGDKEDICYLQLWEKGRQLARGWYLQALVPLSGRSRSFELSLSNEPHSPDVRPMSVAKTCTLTKDRYGPITTVVPLANTN